MAHLIETNSLTQKNEIAFVGSVPWHGLGQQLTPDQPIEVWAKEAGLDWQAKITQVCFKDNQVFAGQNVIYRNDTNKPLGIVTDRYKIHRELIDSRAKTFSHKLR